MKNKLYLIGYSLLTLIILINVVFAAPSDIGDAGIYPKPSAPTLPPAGGSYIDPVFGTEILRVTDRNDLDKNFHNYSQYSPFNADSTRFIISGGPGGTDTLTQLYSLDPVNFTSNKIGPLYAGILFNFGGASWSFNDPNILYGIKQNSQQLYQYEPDTQTYTLIKDFTGLLPAGSLSYLQRSDDDRWFSFLVGPLNNTSIVGVYDKQTDTVYQHDFSNLPSGTRLHTSTLDKSGKYLITQTSGVKEKYVWDVVNDTVEVLTAQQPDYAQGHRDMGTLAAYNKDVNAGGSIIKRDLNDPHNWRYVLQVPGGLVWGQGMHISLNQADESYITVSQYFARGTPPVTSPYEDEIFLVYTDDVTTTSKVKRLAHHRSSGNKYWSQPHASSSIDGKFIMYASDWDGSPYIDVFILKVPQAGSSDTTPPVPPTGLQVN